MLGNLLRIQEKAWEQKDGKETTRSQLPDQDNSKAQIFSTLLLQNQLRLKQEFLRTLPKLSSWINSEKNLQREDLEVFLPLEENSRLLMTTEMELLTKTSSRRPCTISESVSVTSKLQKYSEFSTETTVVM